MIRPLRSIVEWIRGDDTEGDSPERSRFRPSALDLIVRESHGGPNGEIERELQEIDDQARDLESTRRPQ